MRACLFILALMCALACARAAEPLDVKTNQINLGRAGKLDVPTPPDWTMTYTNLGLPDHPITVEFHAPSNSVIVRFYIRWDGFGGKPIKPAEPEMERIVSNNIVSQYLQMSVEKTVNLEKLKGPAVRGIYARLTDAKWTPILKDEYPNFTEGMFRCGNIWGNFNLLTYGKDGPGFQAGLKVLESLRKP